MKIEPLATIAKKGMNNATVNRTGSLRTPRINKPDNAPSSDGLAGASAAARIVRVWCTGGEVLMSNCKVWGTVVSEAEKG